MSQRSSNKLDHGQKEKILSTLRIRFEENQHRHESIAWADVLKRLEAYPEKLWSLHQMEATGGEPDVTGVEKKSGEVVIMDCAAESPKGRRSYCYDRDALESRKKHKPKNSAMDLALEMGIDILTEQQYRELQSLGEFDTRSSSWIFTPPGIRNLGGALFCDRRYDHVFVYHNGAESYYASRGFRGILKI
jgi:hypothetical protein